MRSTFPEVQIRQRTETESDLGEDGGTHKCKKKTSLIIYFRHLIFLGDLLFVFWNKLRYEHFVVTWYPLDSRQATKRYLAELKQEVRGDQSAMEEVQQHTSMPRETRQIQNTLQCQVQIRIRENANKNTRKCRIFLNNQTYLFLSAPLTQGGQLILTNFALNRSLKVFPIEIDQETKSTLIFILTPRVRNVPVY